MEQLINMERDGPVGGRLAAAVMQRTVVLEDTAPEVDEPGRVATDGAADTIPSSDHAGLEADDDAAAAHPRPRREADRQLLANVYTDPKRHTVTLLMDDVTANTVMYAVRLRTRRPMPNAMGFRHLGVDASFLVVVTVGSSWSRACRGPACRAG
jgi:hypothetical protein